MPEIIKRRRFDREGWSGVGLWPNSDLWLLLGKFFKKLFPDPVAPKPYTLVERLKDTEEFQKLSLIKVRTICDELLEAPAFKAEKIGDPDYISTEQFNQLIQNLLGADPYAQAQALIGQSKGDRESPQAFKRRLTPAELKILEEAESIYQARRRIVARLMFHYIDRLYSKLISMRQEFLSLKKGYKRFIFLQQWPQTMQHIKEIFVMCGSRLLSCQQQTALQKKYKKYKKVIRLNINSIIDFDTLDSDFNWHCGYCSNLANWCEEAKIKSLPIAFREMAQEIVRCSARASSVKDLSVLSQEWLEKQAAFFEFLPETSTLDQKIKKMAQISAGAEWALLEKFHKLSNPEVGEALLFEHLTSAGKKNSQIEKQIAVFMLHRARSWKNWYADTFPKMMVPPEWRAREYALLSEAASKKLKEIASKAVATIQSSTISEQFTRQVIRRFPRLASVKRSLDQNIATASGVSETFIDKLTSLEGKLSAFDENRAREKSSTENQFYLTKSNLCSIENFLKVLQLNPSERRLAKETLTAAWLRLLNSVVSGSVPPRLAPLADAITYGVAFDNASVSEVTEFILAAIKLEQTLRAYLSNCSPKNQEELLAKLKTLLSQKLFAAGKREVVAALVETVLQALPREALEQTNDPLEGTQDSASQEPPREALEQTNDLLEGMQDSASATWVEEKIQEQLAKPELSGKVCENEGFATIIEVLRQQEQAIAKFSNLELLTFLGTWSAEKTRIVELCEGAANRNTAEFEENIRKVNEYLVRIDSAHETLYAQSFGEINKEKNNWKSQKQQTLYEAVLAETPQTFIASTKAADSSEIVALWNARQMKVLSYLQYFSFPRALDQIVSAELAFFAYIKANYSNDSAVFDQAQKRFVERLNGIGKTNPTLKQQMIQLILKQARSWRNWVADSFLGIIFPSDWQGRKYDLLNAETEAVLSLEPVARVVLAAKPAADAPAPAPATADAATADAAIEAVLPPVSVPIKPEVVPSSLPPPHEARVVVMTVAATLEALNALFKIRSTYTHSSLPGQALVAAGTPPESPERPWAGQQGSCRQGQQGPTSAALFKGGIYVQQSVADSSNPPSNRLAHQDLVY